MLTDRAFVTIAPQVLAVPELDCDESAARHYVETLLDWSDLLDEPWIAIQMSERAAETLSADGLYPLREKLQEVFDKHGVREYSPNDVAKVVERLLASTPSFETFYRVKDVIYDHIETIPDVIRLTAYAGLQMDLARCITLLAIIRKHCDQPLGGHTIILPSASAQTVAVKARIEYLEHQRDDIPTLPTAPEVFEGEVLTCDDFNGLVACIDEGSILAGASDNFGVELSIRLAAYKQRVSRGEETDWNEIFLPRIGWGFRERCQQCCRDQTGSLPTRVLGAILDIMNGERLAHVHAIRTGRAGNSPQLLRGRDKAQRRDIDHEFHLHYWELEDGNVELAAVVYHNDFTIPE